MKFRFPKYKHKPYPEGVQHGPKTFPWWRLVSINVVRCSHDPICLFWNPPHSYNIWVYTRWWAYCVTFTLVEGVYIAYDLWDAALERWHKEARREGRS